VQLRLTVLFLGIATHSTLAKVMYAYELPRDAGHSPEQIRAAAKLMYYGGDLAELLVAIAFFATWSGRRFVGRLPARAEAAALQRSS
jgi:putative membrane protein